MLAALYTAEQAYQAANARRDNDLNDPELRKLKPLSVSAELDIQRIFAQTETVSAYINRIRDFAAASANRKENMETYRRLETELDELYEKMTPWEEQAVNAMNLAHFLDWPGSDYDLLATFIPPQFRPIVEVEGHVVAHTPLIRRIFEKHNVSSQRSKEEARACALIKKAYTVMSCNDPKQPVISELKQFLQDFGVFFEDMQAAEASEA